MHRFRWAAVTTLAAVALVGVACSSDNGKTEATPTKAAADATVATTSAATSSAATAAAKASVAPSPAATATVATVTPAGADGTVKAIISGFKLPTLTVKTGTVVESS